MKCKHIFIASLLAAISGLSSDAWGQWTQTSCPNQATPFCIGVNGASIVAGFNSVGIFRSTDEGNSWQPANDGLVADEAGQFYISCFTVNGSNLFAGTDEGVFISHDSGKSWQAANNGLPLFSAHPLQPYAFAVSGATMFAATDSGVFLTSDSGKSWVKSSSGLPRNPVSCLATIGTKLFACDSGVYRSTDNGSSWLAVNTSLGDSGITAFAVSGTHLFVSTWKGVFRSNNDGSQWENVSNGLPASEIRRVISSGIYMFAGTSDGRVFLSNDSGALWIETSTGLFHSSIVSFAVSAHYLFLGTGTQGIWRRPLSEFGIDAVRNVDPVTGYLSIYPNPTTGVVTIGNAPEDIQHVSVAKILGESVIELGKPAAPEFTLDLSKLPAGIYIMRIESSGSLITRKIVKE